MSEADFGRVCDNLVGNALAAMGERGVIELSLVFDGRAAVLRVDDTAGGMDEAFLPLAFDRFSRADDARTGGGAGLGLSIVAGIVSVSGGTIVLDNRPGHGLSRFSGSMRFKNVSFGSCPRATSWAPQAS